MTSKVHYMDNYLRFINVDGIIFPVVMKTGFVTIDMYGDIELWYDQPYISGNGWDHQLEYGIDAGNIGVDPKRDWKTMCFDVETGEKV